MTLNEEDKKQLIKYNIEKTEKEISDISFYIKNNKLSVAVNRIYYSIYYMLSALALENGFLTSKHAQLIGWFNKEYVKTNKIERRYGKIIRNTFEQRSKADYDVLITFTKPEVENLFKEMKEVIQVLKKLF